MTMNAIGMAATSLAFAVALSSTSAAWALADETEPDVTEASQAESVAEEQADAQAAEAVTEVAPVEATEGNEAPEGEAAEGGGEAAEASLVDEAEAEAPESTQATEQEAGLPTEAAPEEVETAEAADGPEASWATEATGTPETQAAVEAPVETEAAGVADAGAEASETFDDATVADETSASKPDAADADADSDEPGRHAAGWAVENGVRCYYDEDGVRLTGEQLIDGSWYYLDPETGAMRTGWVWQPVGDGAGSGSFKRTYYASDGTRVCGTATIDGATYYFDLVTGALTTGFVDAGDGLSFYALDTARLVTGQQLEVNGETRSFDADGSMQTGFVDQGGQTVYYDDFDGALGHGLAQIGGSWYYLDPWSGAVSHGMTWVPDWGAYAYFDLVSGAWTQTVNWWEASGVSRPDLWDVVDLNIEVSISKQQVYVKSGSTVIYAMVASTGVLDGYSDTPLGNYSVTGRGYSFYNESEQMGARYYVQFFGDYLFHSVPTDAWGSYIATEGAKLGQPASHGCVRLTVSDAKWLYEQVPDSTPVWIHW